MERTYTVAAIGPKIDNFLKTVCKRANLHVRHEVADGDNPHPEFENPEVVVRFSGEDVDLLLSNKAELLLALEQLGFAAQFVMAVGIVAVAALGLALGLAFGLGCRDLARDFVVEYLRSLEPDEPKRPS